MAKSTPAQLFAKFFRVFMDTAAAPTVRAEAEKRMDAWLKHYAKTRADIQSILVQAARDDAAAAPPPPPSDPRDTAPAEPLDPHDTVLSLVCGAFKTYLALNSHEYVAMALWAMHTHVYDRYMVTPRLLLTSPVRGCGKSVGLDVLSRLVARPELTDNITAAAIYDTIDRLLCTLLLDEFDNQEISTKAAMRAVLNAGYRKSRKIHRGVGKNRRAYRVFAPIAIAAIGTLSLPLMSRSIVIRMQRNDHWRKLRRFDFNDTGALDRVYVQTRDWARYVKLDSDPQLPSELVDRLADNWRPLIAIADSFGAEWGRIARATAVFFAKDYREEDVPVLLLRSIREVFDALGVDRITGKALLEALHRLEEAGWSEFTGVKNDRPPRKLRNSDCAPCCACSALSRVRSGVWGCASPAIPAPRATIEPTSRLPGVPTVRGAKPAHRHKSSLYDRQKTGEIADVPVCRFFTPSAEERNEMTTLQGDELEAATKDITEAMREALETCVERGMKLPFILCSASPNGSVICMRVRGGGIEPEELCEHFEPEGFRMPVTLMVLDQNGEAARITITAEHTIFH